MCRYYKILASFIKTIAIILLGINTLALMVINLIFTNKCVKCNTVFKKVSCSMIFNYIPQGPLQLNIPPKTVLHPIILNPYLALSLVLLSY